MLGTLDIDRLRVSWLSHPAAIEVSPIVSDNGSPLVKRLAFVAAEGWRIELWPFSIVAKRS